MLQNTGVSDVQQLLKQLFDELPMNRGNTGKVVIVADERLNALIVHGSRRDQEIVEELLQILDTSELPDPLSTSRPELLPLRNTQARRVLEILQNVYRNQLTSGGGRKPVPIPKGISTGVASVLQQINAAAAGPLLTLDVDQTTNSIVMRAPPELREEIKAFVERLDGQASQRPSRGIRVIRLKNSKADRMQAVLQQFMLRQK
jgi:type II secretory pathway component GspD/PulD (secretin)